MTNLLASPFSPQGLTCQPPPLINATLNLSVTKESFSKFEAKATPLHIACRNYNTPDSIILAVSRANTLALDLQDDDGDTPIHLALRSCISEDVLHTLIEHAYYQTLHQLDYNMDDDEEGVAFAKSDYKDGDLPLHVAISHDASIDIIQLLVESYPQGIFGINHALQTPLMVACIYGRYDVVDEVILKSNAVIGCVRDLLEMGGDNMDGGRSGPVYCLWENFVAEKNERVDIVGDIKALETIAKLLAAATSSDTTDYQPIACETAPGDTHDKQVNHPIIGTTIPKYSFDQTYQLLQAAVSLGEGIVPPGYLSFLVQIHPGIIHTIHTSPGCTHVHNAVMQLYHPNLFLTCDYPGPS